MHFFVGLHQPSDAHRFERCFISVNRLRERKSRFEVGDWILDSGAFTEISTHGEYRQEPGEYAEQVNRWADCGNLLAAVSQDYMCEPFILEKTGLTVRDHQQLTVTRYDALQRLVTQCYLMPVLQGYQPHEYVEHLRQYPKLQAGQWVGVGSVCKRNSRVRAVEEVLLAIKEHRPDLRLHGFGLKVTALKSGLVRSLLHSADSMAWSYAARKKGRDANSWEEAASFEKDILSLNYGAWQLMLSFEGRER